MFNTKINIRYAIYLIIFGVLVITGCSSDDDNSGESGYGSLSLDKVTISASEKSQFIEIKTNSEWELSINFPEGTGAWCMIEEGKTKGKGSAFVVLKYYPNLDTEDRKATIVLEIAGNEIKQDIVQKGKTPTDNPTTPEPTQINGWLELPENISKNGCQVITHYTNIGNRKVRSFTLFYDTNEKMAYWVAYPLHRSYIGKADRTNAWAPDPALSHALQPNLSKGFGNGYDRGHQIPSADRTVDITANRQTFFYTNMTAQNSGLNQGVWANLEGQCRSWMAKYDTLYVTTGAILKTKTGNETWNQIKNSSIPNYYFKVLLGKKGSTYNSVGFWFENKDYPKNRDFIKYAKTVRDIESLTGFNFFSNLPQNIQDEVETSFRAQDWGL